MTILTGSASENFKITALNSEQVEECNEIKKSNMMNNISSISNNSSTYDDSIVKNRSEMKNIVLKIKKKLEPLMEKLKTAFNKLPFIDSKKNIDTFKEVRTDMKNKGADYQKLLEEISKQKDDIIKQVLQEGLHSDIETLNTEFESLLDRFKSAGASNELTYKIAELQYNEKIAPFSKIERNLGIINTVSTTLNLEKSLISNMYMAMKVTEKTSNTSMLFSSIVPVLGVVGSAITIPLNVAIMSSGITEVVLASKQHEQVKNNQTALDVFSKRNESANNAGSQIKEQAIQSSREILSETQNFNRQQQVAGTIKTVSAGVKMGASAANFSIIGAPAGMALSGVGLALSIAGEAHKSVYQDRQKIFFGLKASDSACELVAAQHIVFDAVKETVGIVDSTAASMDHHQMMLAEAKLHSVIQSVLNKNWERKTGKSANYLHDKIEKKMNKLVNKLIYGTTLVASDLNTMKKVLQEKYAVDFFTGDRGMLQQKLNNNIEENMKSIGLQVSDETYVKIMQTTLSELSLIEDKNYFR